MRNKSHLSNEHVLIACGVILGISLGFILGAIIGFSKDKFVANLLMGSKPEDWRLQWETLLGGLLALTAAALTVIVMRWQTHHLIERKEMATRAMLPLSLMAMIEYSERCLKYLRTLKGLHVNNSFDRDKYEQIKHEIQISGFPDEKIRDIKEYIENSDHLEAIKLAKYIATLQVHRSRIQKIQQNSIVGGSDNLNSIGSIRSSIIDCAEIYRFSEKILEFSRGRTKTIGTVTSDDIHSCLWWFIHFDYESDSDLKTRSSKWTPLMDDCD